MIRLYVNTKMYNQESCRGICSGAILDYLSYLLSEREMNCEIGNASQLGTHFLFVAIGTMVDQQFNGAIVLKFAIDTIVTC